MKDSFKKFLLYAAYVIIFFCSFKNDFYVFNNSTSIDFLYRVIGSRLMQNGKSPYYDKWQADDKTTFKYYHPIPRYTQKINGVTVTPAFLWLNTVFAGDDFCTAAKWWFYIQLTALFVSGVLILSALQQFRKQLIALIAFTLFFLFSRNFYMHLHSAQVYVLYGLIFCTIYWLLKSKFKNKYLLTGVLITIAVWLKPLFIVLIIPFLLNKNKQFIKGACITAAILLLQVILSGQIKYWKEYSSAMAEYATDVTQASKQENFLQIFPPTFPVSYCIYPMKYPDKLPLTATGLRSAQYYLMKVGITISDPKVFACSALILVLIISFFYKKENTPEKMFALLFLLYLMVELFTPALRFGYYLVQWSAAAIIVLCNYKQNKFSAILMLLGLLINNGYLPFPQVYSGSVGEALMLMALIIYIIPMRVELNDSTQ